MIKKNELIKVGNEYYAKKMLRNVRSIEEHNDFSDVYYHWWTFKKPLYVAAKPSEVMRAIVEMDK